MRPSLPYARVCQTRLRPRAARRSRERRDDRRARERVIDQPDGACTSEDEDEEEGKGFNCDATVH